MYKKYPPEKDCSGLQTTPEGGILPLKSEIVQVNFSSTITHATSKFAVFYTSGTWEGHLNKSGNVRVMNEKM